MGLELFVGPMKAATTILATGAMETTQQKLVFGCVPTNECEALHRGVVVVVVVVCLCGAMGVHVWEFGTQFARLAACPYSSISPSCQVGQGPPMFAWNRL